MSHGQSEAKGTLISRAFSSDASVRWRHGMRTALRDRTEPQRAHARYHAPVCGTGRET